MDEQPSLVFGPVPSRRLGRSLGINNIPPKICSYSCAYCQVGRTIEHAVEPRAMYPPERVAGAVAARVQELRDRGEHVDHLTFVPDGEPTLDAGLGETIALLRPLDIPIAVISNGSLLWRREVRERLRQASWVSIKVDAVTDHTWRQVNRPAHALDLATVLAGMHRFAHDAAGTVVSETMLVRGLNDDAASVAAVGAFLGDLGINTAYLAIPTRPPPDPSVTAPDEATVTRAHQVLARFVPRVELLIGYEGDEFAASGDPRSDLLAILAVHPMRRSAVLDLLDRSNAGVEVLDALLAEGLVTETRHEAERYYLRRFAHRPASGGSAAPIPVRAPEHGSM